MWTEVGRTTVDISILTTLDSNISGHWIEVYVATVDGK
jgi:hypothetical protein